MGKFTPNTYSFIYIGSKGNGQKIFERFGRWLAQIWTQSEKPQAPFCQNPPPRWCNYFESNLHSAFDRWGKFNGSESHAHSFV